jgi:divinyl protochlorophyllide a 8-vinyl-reductase
VGPNAVIQLGVALAEQEGPECARRVFARAGVPQLLLQPPEAMIEQETPAALFDAACEILDPPAASRVLARAGRLTADYLLRHRIPRPVAALLRRLPRGWAARLLLRAIERNAWTFAGSGRFAVHLGSPHVVEIADNPLTTPGCVWHVAVFERLFRALVSPGANVCQLRCCREGDPLCRFEIALEGRLVR